MMTATQILKSSFPQVRDASRYVEATPHSNWEPRFLTTPRYKNRSNYGAPSLSVRVSSTATGPDGKPKTGAHVKHLVVVQGRDKDQHLFSGNILVHCDCDYFTYTCEVALYKRGASVIKNSNGEDPVVKNPQLTPTPCKHLYHVLTTIVKRRIG